MTWPLVIENDGGIRPAGKPDQCFYCRQRVGQPHGPDCVMVTKRVLIRIVSDDKMITGLWTLDVPHSWTSETIEFVYNENTWCASNIIGRERVTWDQQDAADKLKKLEGNGCLCGKLLFKFVRVLDDTPRRKLDHEI